MYKVLIVDDEYWVGRWVTDVIGKEMPELAVAGVCEDGDEALRFLQSTSVDILITDINMPVVSGLDLIRGIGERGRMPKTVVISGYDEFEYARQAIELDVLAYLIKPLKKEELVKALTKAMGELDQELAQGQTARTGCYARMENLLAEFFQNPREGLRQKMDQVFEKMGIAGQWYVFGIIQNTRMEMPDFSKDDLRNRLGLACRGRDVFLFLRNPYTWVFMIAGIEQASGFYLDESALCRVFKSCFFGVSKAHRDLGEIEAAEMEAKGSILGKLGHREDEEQVGELRTDHNAEFLAAIRARDKERVSRCSAEAEADFLKTPYDLTGCLNFYFVLAGDVIKMLAESYMKQKRDIFLNLMNEGYAFSAQIRDFYSIPAICRRFEEYSLSVIDSLNATGPMKGSAIVQRVERMIRERYASDLNLGSIADEFDINPSYFSKKFKEETGVNFLDYLARVRIEQAQALLDHTDLSIASVSRQVGFHDPKYFSRVFLALTGVKPSEYRAKAEEDGL